MNLNNNRAARAIALVYSACCYVVFLITFLYLIGFVGSVAVPKNINDGPLLAWPLAVLINCALILLFGVQHTVMARKGFKRWLAAVIPTSVERSTYVLLSSLVLVLMFWLWQPMTLTVWEVETTWAKGLLIGLFWLGWGIALLATFLIGHFELFGLKQPIDRWRRATPQAPEFRTPLFYKIVRHPLYLGFLIAFWATPHMTAGHLLFSMGMTVYIFIGASFEEKDLVALFGERYRRYQQEVGMILPWAKSRKKDAE
ncbi:isoprenylcysteine carboxylmethyltransferase family protein [Pseudomonas sp. S1Bt30]|uniref:methanethiol S-methyltransferase n=1 Tax=Pseudomonas quebecensis TaxID=2995174 RepID=A0ABY6QMC7_9PSED|nr:MULTISPECIES: methanethiol S-methyltransferase [Pseudomonas]MCX4065715.1 isoprenylcysteine carboxylmethyltransferase family protein [Pseudomonas quebecensis]UZW20613.1 isoprenylcysteine carboxylmethyltransferase family protein [Pseudomonas quebecensis]UZW21969.1 isoprenylcysteine carboxylmethyltransferase family protein [Pseudomonas quebecensis]UZW27029.1 isoprenylcysteine carboxylmethyltransferase family protein [Pseudomonas quebecensis]